MKLVLTEESEAGTPGFHPKLQKGPSDPLFHNNPPMIQQSDHSQPSHLSGRAMCVSASELRHAHTSVLQVLSLELP